MKNSTNIVFGYNNKKKETHTIHILKESSASFICYSYEFCICTALPRFSKEFAMINLTTYPYCCKIAKNFYICVYIIYNIHIMNSEKNRTLTSRCDTVVEMDMCHQSVAI